MPAHAQGQQRTRQPGWPCVGTVDPVYVRGAEATGGVVMLFKPTEIAGAAAEMSASNRHPEVVLRAGGQLAEGVYEFEVPLDSTVKSAYVFASMQCLQRVSVTGPSGDELRTDADGVEYHHFEAIRLFTVREPTAGLWKVTVAGRGFFSLIVRADTDLRLTGVKFAAEGFPLKRLPTPQRLEVSMSGAAGDVGFHFISGSAANIETVTLGLENERDSERTYAGEVAPPTGEFRLSVTGTDAKGFRFQRVQKQLVVAER